jgi:ATP/maltotriose-dependent transcriptional regulator MalT
VVAIGLSLGVLGLLRYFAGEYQTADDLLEQAVQELHHAGIPVAVAWARSWRARVAVVQADPVRAIELSSEAARLVRTFNLKGRAPFVLEVLAEALASAGQMDRAVLLAGAADAMREQIGTTSPPTEKALVEQWLEPVRSALGARADEVWARGSLLSLDEAVATALTAPPAQSR